MRQSTAAQLARAQATPVPNSPISSVPEDAAENRESNQLSQNPSTASLETDQTSDGGEPNMEPV